MRKIMKDKSDAKDSESAKSSICAFAAICAFAISLLSGCGYTTHAILPSGGASIHVDNFLNKIDVTREASNDETYYAYIPAMESDITREVISRFIFDGNYEVRGPAEANLLLKGNLVGFRRDPLRYDDGESVTEYRVSVICDIELSKVGDSQVLWKESSFAGVSTYRTEGQFAKSESAATREAIKDLARRIVERTVEDW
ncbi:MAG: LPS assembly lipoprotein LptE [Candidatus Omnitrophota bacterium]